MEDLGTAITFETAALNRSKGVFESKELPVMGLIPFPSSLRNWIVEEVRTKAEFLRLNS